MKNEIWCGDEEQTRKLATCIDEDGDFWVKVVTPKGHRGILFITEDGVIEVCMCGVELAQLTGMQAENGYFKVNF